MLKEFQEFAVKGNVVDMGVGIVIGAAFTSIVNSLVNDIINPIIGMITGGVDFSNFFVNLGAGEYENLVAAQAAGAPTVNYGLFVNAIISFLIVAWILFFIIRAVNHLRKAAEEAPASPETPDPAADVKLLTEIRDLLARGAAPGPQGAPR
jgi:large conductance mechanosensitive channel